jgi:hypothetical protein
MQGPQSILGEAGRYPHEGGFSRRFAFGGIFLLTLLLLHLSMFALYSFLFSLLSMFDKIKLK